MSRGHGRGSLEQLPSGSWRAEFRAPDGSRPRRTFRDLDDAEDWLAEHRIAVKRGLWRPPKPPAPILRDWAETWIVQRRNRKGQSLRPRTAAEYRRTVAGALGPLLPRALDEITPADVRGWYVGLDDRPTHQANAYGLLRAMLATAVEDGILVSNPCRVHGGSVKDRASRTNPLTPAEVTQLAAAMPMHLRAAVLLAAWSGLRAGELFALRRCDVSPDGREVTVAQAVTWTKGTVHVGDPKSRAGLRIVAIPPHVSIALVEHLHLWTGPPPAALVFTSTRGNRLRHSTLYRHFYTARTEIGRPDLRWHDLRHTGATLAAQAGATVAELQARIGHSTPAAAMIYQHATGERDRLIADQLSQLAEPRLRAVP